MPNTAVVVPGPLLHFTMNTSSTKERQQASVILAGANLCLIVVLPEEVSAVGVWQSSRVWWLVEAESLIARLFSHDRSHLNIGFDDRCGYYRTTAATAVQTATDSAYQIVQGALSSILVLRFRNQPLIMRALELLQFT